jgi:hypothetical protein
MPQSRSASRAMSWRISSTLATSSDREYFTRIRSSEGVLTPMYMYLLMPAEKMKPPCCS